jgi:hypothetical protein
MDLPTFRCNSGQTKGSRLKTLCLKRQCAAAFRIVTRRRVDIVITLLSRQTTREFGLVKMVMQLTVRKIRCFPELRNWSVDRDVAVEIGVIGNHKPVQWVELSLSIYDKPVPIRFWRKWRGGSAPDTGCSLPTDVGKQTPMPYTADYYFYEANQ